MILVRTILAALATIVALAILTPLFLVVLPFWLVSALTRVIARASEPKFLTRDQLIQFDPDFGWRARPNLNTHHLMVDLFHIRTDEKGWRGKSSLEESGIVVFGDSFAAGYGVSDRYFFANLDGEYRIKPIGIGGYSMVQELLWMQHLRSSLQSKLVVWFIFYGNDLYDNLAPDLRGYRKPFVRETGDNGDWEIVSLHVTRERWPLVTQGRMKGENHLPKLAEICSDSFLAGRAYNACEFLIGEGKQICDDVDAQLFVVSIPDAMQLTRRGQDMLRNLGADPRSFDSDLPDKKIGSICQRLGVGFLAGTSFLDISCYKTNDCHWNEKGHRTVHETLVRLKQQKQSKPVSATQKVTAALPALN
jgi:hypothetical protein